MSRVVICSSARGRGRAAARNKAKVKRSEMDTQQITTIAIQGNYSTIHTSPRPRIFPAFLLISLILCPDPGHFCPPSKHLVFRTFRRLDSHASLVTLDFEIWSFFDVWILGLGSYFSVTVFTHSWLSKYHRTVSLMPRSKVYAGTHSSSFCNLVASIA